MHINNGLSPSDGQTLINNYNTAFKNVLTKEQRAVVTQDNKVRTQVNKEFERLARNDQISQEELINLKMTFHRSSQGMHDQDLWGFGKRLIFEKIEQGLFSSVLGLSGTSLRSVLSGQTVLKFETVADMPLDVRNKIVVILKDQGRPTTDEAIMAVAQKYSVVEIMGSK